MRIAFMFPGQGAQSIGMGKDLYENYEEVRKIFNKASEITNIDIATLCFNGIKREYNPNEGLLDDSQTAEDLNKTENTQIAIATMSLAILEILKKENINAELAVGLSLGEYSALMYAGYLEFEDGIRLLKQRGYLMGNRVPKDDYSMAAVIGLESTKIEEICKKLQEENLFVVPANYNYSNQTVISGTLMAIDKAMDILKEAGAKKVIKLQTSGPFHTSKLNDAKLEYSKELDKVSFKQGKIDVIKNIDGTVYSKEDNIKEILANHIISPVRFDKAIRLMQDKGIDTFIEVGPGKALSGFVKKELSDVKVLNISDCESLEKTLNELKA